jgi:hypothetical protein
VFARYQLTKTLPYFVKRWVFCRKDARLEPLYRTDGGNYEKGDGEANGNGGEGKGEKKVDDVTDRKA